MRGLKKALAIILVINMIMGMVPNLMRLVHAEIPVAVNVNAYNAGKATFNWNMEGVRSVQIQYHSPGTGNSAIYNNILVDASDMGTINAATVQNLKNDYIYDVRINMYDDLGGENGTGRKIASGFIQFLPQISLYGEIVDQQPVVNSAGGSESGVMPSLKLSWNVPRIYDIGSNSFIPMNTAAAFSKLNPDVSKFNYKINITDSVNRADVDIVWNRSGSTNSYTASVAGDSRADRISDVKFDSATERYYFYLLGVKEEGSRVPEIIEVRSNNYNGQAVLPESISKKGENNLVLPDGDILPGTVYYLKINPLPSDNGSNYLNCMAVGPNGSSLLGSFSYIYTPIRFELTKDSIDNVNVKIYKVNKGNLNMPQLYYEVQMNSIPSDQDNTWNQGPFKDKGKKLDGTYFTGQFTYAVITGISPNNTVYYRIVVKSNSTNDRIESLKMPYIIKNDVAKPPIPKNVTIVNRQLVTKDGVQDKSTDVTISWDKPENWEEIKKYNINDDILFNFLVSLNQSDLPPTVSYPLEAGGKFYGNFPVKYRLIGYVSAHKVIEKGNRLEYTIKGFDLFKGEHWSSTQADGTPAYTVSDFNPHEKDADGKEYPGYLLPNKTYYLQVYTTKASDRLTTDEKEMSSKSLTVSFTTLTGTERDVPLPANFKLSTPPTQDTVELQFDKVRIDWSNYTASHTENDKIYYDLYMSTRPDANSFIRIGTTELMEENNTDITFLNVKDTQSTYIKARINKFRPGIGGENGNFPYDVFGESLKPNTTYYFIVRTRLNIEKPLFPISPSISTVVLPVTTARGPIDNPDDTERRPLAPEDFAIAKDDDGNLLITGQSVTFNWTKREDGVKYALICTSEKVAPGAQPAAYENDPVYKSFIKAFGNRDNDVDGDSSTYTLDPARSIESGIFEYDSKTKTFKLKIDTWIFPNRLYYFSLRAVPSASTGKKPSVWISIPVTTMLVEAPTMLAPVNDAELGFNWNGSADAKAEDYKILLKGPKDSDYKVLAKSQYTIVKDGVACYGRIFNLKGNSSYSIRVYEGNGSNAVYDKTGLYTRDDYHQIEVKWKGMPVDPYTRYEIAIKTADAAEYTVLTDADMEQYLTRDGKILPYYTEKTLQTIGTSYSMFYVKIKTMNITLPDGTVIKRPLKSNMKYYVKVRVVKYDPANTALVSYSKYIGPVDTRTEFNQDDYDDTDDDLQKEATYLDRMAKLEEKPYWRVEMSNTTANKVLLKGDRMANIIENSSGYPFVLDVSGLAPSINVDVVYIPVIVAKTLNYENKSLILKASGSEYTIRPGTLNVEDAAEVTLVKGKQGVKDLFLKVTLTRSEYPASEIPKGTKRISKVNNFELQVLGSSKTDKQLKEEFFDRLYNDKTGIVKLKKDILSNPYNNNTNTPEKLNKYIDQLVKETESELSDYIKSTVEGINGYNGMVVVKESMKSFGTPMVAKLTYTEQKGLKLPYALYDDSNAWQKITRDLVYPASGYVMFSAAKTGKYGVFAVSNPANDLPDGYWAKADINRFMSRYDLTDVFSGLNDSFNPETSVSTREVVLLYEKVMNKAQGNSGLDIKQKVKAMGLDGIVNLNSLLKDSTRQETAAILMKVYSSKLGTDYDSLKPAKTIFIQDEWEVSTKYYKQVTMVIDLGVMVLDDNGRFKPKAFVTRAEVVAAFVKILELAGEM